MSDGDMKIARPLLPFDVREQLSANIAKAERGEADTAVSPVAKHIKASINEHKREVKTILNR